MILSILFLLFLVDPIVSLAVMALLGGTYAAIYLSIKKQLGAKRRAEDAGEPDALQGSQ